MIKVTLNIKFSFTAPKRRVFKSLIKPRKLRRYSTRDFVKGTAVDYIVVNGLRSRKNTYEQHVTFKLISTYIKLFR